MKHSLLPEQYADSATHSALLSAMKPFERMADSADPKFRWDLAKAWLLAKPLLAGARWRFLGDADLAVDAGWELAADTLDENDGLHGIVAGLLAHQIQFPDDGISIRRIEYRKGGEIGLIISNAVQRDLEKMFPGATYERGGAAGAQNRGLFARLLAKLGLGKTA